MVTKYKSRCPAGGLFWRWRADLEKKRDIFFTWVKYNGNFNLNMI